MTSARTYRTTRSGRDALATRLGSGLLQVSSICMPALVIAIAACSGNPGPETASPVGGTATRVEPTPTIVATSTPTAAVATATLSPTAIPTRAATATAEPTPIASGAATSPSAPDGLVRGGVLRFAVPELPPHLDVHQTQSPALLTWGPALAYSRLFRFTTGVEAPSPNTIVECDLCASWRLLDPVSLEVKLRANIRWPAVEPVDGRRLTAHDVVFSYERQMTDGWPNAPVLANVAHVEAMDDRTVLIRFRQPEAEFLHGLADGHSRIVAPEAVAVAGDLLRGPTIGTGPWLAARIGNDGAEYEANPDYYENGFPFLDGLNVQIVNIPEIRAAALRNGQLDFDRSSYQSVIDAKSAFPGIESAAFVDPGAGAELIMNTIWEPFDSQEVRTAVLHAINPWTLNQSFWNGQSMPTMGLRVPEPDWLLTPDDIRGAFAKRGAAREVLGEAPGVVRLTVGQFDANFPAQAEFIATSMSELGLRTTVEEISTREYADRVWVGGDYQMALGALPPISSLTGALLAVHHSRGGVNTTNHEISELDELIESQAVEFDESRRKEQVLEIQRIILAGAYRINLAARAENWMWWDYVEGFAPNMARGENFFFTKVWLSRQP